MSPFAKYSNISNLIKRLERVDLSGVDEDGEKGEGKRLPPGQSDFISISQLESSRWPHGRTVSKKSNEKELKSPGGGEGVRNKERRERLRQMDFNGFRKKETQLKEVARERKQNLIKASRPSSSGLNSLRRICRY